uniref:chlorophyll a/b-binding protein n=1 Tax=Cyanobium sp. TaxID=2164130 RepID=UPI004048A34E
MSSGRPPALARRGFSESENQGWCSDEPELLDPRPIEPAVQVVSQERAWGFHHPAELLNGRLAMLGFVLAVATEWLTGQGALGQLHALLP